MNLIFESWRRYIEEAAIARKSAAGIKKSIKALTGQGGNEGGNPTGMKKVTDPLEDKDDAKDISAPPSAPGGLEEEADLSEEEESKKPCKPSKGKRFAKRVDGKCRSYGQSGQAKSGGDRIRPGTKKGDAYCARSAKIKKCKNPPCANDLSRKKWKCRGSKSVAE
jgi:hypothetical protein